MTLARQSLRRSSFHSREAIRRLLSGDLVGHSLQQAARSHLVLASIHEPISLGALDLHKQNYLLKGYTQGQVLKNQHRFYFYPGY